MDLSSVTEDVLRILNASDIDPNRFGKFLLVAQADTAEQIVYAKRFLIDDLRAMGYTSSNAKSMAEDIVAKPVLYEALIGLAFNPETYIQRVQERDDISEEENNRFRRQIYHRSAMSYMAFIFDQSIDNFKCPETEFSDAATAVRYEIERATSELSENPNYYWERLNEALQYYTVEELPADLQAYRLMIPFWNYYQEIAGDEGWNEVKDLTKTLADVLAGEHLANLAGHVDADEVERMQPYHSLVEDSTGERIRPYSRSSLLAKHMLYNGGYFMVAANLYSLWKYEQNHGDGRTVRDLMRYYPPLADLVRFQQCIVRVLDDIGDLSTDIERNQPSSVIEACYADDFVSVFCDYAGFSNGDLSQKLMAVFETATSLYHMSNNGSRVDLAREINRLLRNELIPSLGRIESELSASLICDVLLNDSDRALTFDQIMYYIHDQFSRQDVMVFEKILNLVAGGAKANGIYHDLVAQSIGRQQPGQLLM